MKNIPKVILIPAILTIIFNIFDACSTVYFIQNGLAYEANPIMAWLMDFGMEWFMFYKVVFLTIAIAVVARYHKYKISKYGLWGVCFVYGLVCLYHIFGFYVFVL